MTFEQKIAINTVTPVAASSKNRKQDFSIHIRSKAEGRSMSDPIQQFKNAMAARGIIPPANLIADGQIHRCDTTAPNGKGDASYLLHLDGIPAGGFQNHQDGIGWENWRADVSRTFFTRKEVAMHRAEVEKMQLKRTAEKAMRHAAAREEACLILANSWQGNAAFPYLIAKGIGTHGAQSYWENGSSIEKLVIPLKDMDGKTHSLQYIYPDGRKMFHPGGRIHGCFHLIGKPDGVLCIAEGFATGASVHMATGYAVAVAFDCGNLLAVAKAFQAEYTDLQLIICADDDWLIKGNPGKTKAYQAAQVVNGVVALPLFGNDRPKHATDFNDMATLYGLQAVKEAIMSAELHSIIHGRSYLSCSTI